MSFINKVVFLLTFLAAAIVAAGTSLAQSYYHSPNDTIIAVAPFNDVSVYNILQAHPTGDTLHFVWHRQMVSLPSGWEASICDAGDCATTLKDSGAMGPIVPGDDGLMSLHVNPFSIAGTGIVRYSIYETNTPTQVDTLTWIISANASAVAQQNPYPKPRVYTSNHQLICSNLNANYRHLYVYGLDGRLFYSTEVRNAEMALSLSEWASQHLIVRLVGTEMLITHIINN